MAKLTGKDTRKAIDVDAIKEMLDKQKEDIQKLMK